MTQKSLSTNQSGNPKWLKYFFYMGKTERELVRHWYTTTTFVTQKQKKFKKIIKKALKIITYNYWISTLEPVSVDFGKIDFIPNEPPAHFMPSMWKALAMEFAPAWDSDLSNLYELFLFYAYRIAKGYWSIDFVCDLSHDENKPLISYLDMEYTGARKVGGFYDGIGNTYKIVTYKKEYVNCGIPYYNNNFNDTVSSFHKVFNTSSCFNSSAVIVLRKSLLNNFSIEPPKTEKPQKKTTLSKEMESINKLKQLSETIEFGENNKAIAAIVTKLYEIEKLNTSDSINHTIFSYIFEVYLPEFTNLLTHYANLKKSDSVTTDENIQLTKGVKKFYDFLYNQKFENDVDVETTKIQFDASINTFINMLEKEIH